LGEDSVEERWGCLVAFNNCGVAHTGSFRFVAVSVMGSMIVKTKGAPALKVLLKSIPPPVSINGVVATKRPSFPGGEGSEGFAQVIIYFYAPAELSTLTST